VAGLVAGDMSMAAGEYVSVQSQADTEAAVLETEKRELDMQMKTSWPGTSDRKRRMDDRS
jgi:VIT1/CCC1 family predicted Fe2+/Mn2+ transporter